MSDTFFDRRDGYGLMLDEYNGKFKLICGRQKDDKTYMDWCYLSKWNKEIGGPEPDDKKRPLGAYLGDRDDAIKALRFFLKELGATDPGDPAPDGSGENVPF
jgi:hypothetical protein